MPDFCCLCVTSAWAKPGSLQAECLKKESLGLSLYPLLIPLFCVIYLPFLLLSTKYVSLLLCYVFLAFKAIIKTEACGGDLLMLSSERVWIPLIALCSSGQQSLSEV
uniref:Uncharacterized protein n=2 Tax=Micrurus TaxID=8634 RepID=A0A2D4N9W5_9SAUR